MTECPPRLMFRSGRHFCRVGLNQGPPGSVYSPGYPAPLRTDIWHPAPTEEDLKEKGVFSSKKNSLDFVENCDFLINKKK